MNQEQNKISIRDKHFAVAWSMADTPKIEEYTKRLVSMYGKPGLQTEYTALADQMLTLINKRENDHYNATADLAGHDWLRVDPLDVQVGDDMCTFQGLNKVLRIYLGTAIDVFKWVGYGTAAATPTPYTTRLTLETGTRQDSTTTGFNDIKGASLRIFSSYATTVATVEIYQIGVFDSSVSGILLAIHDFGGFPLSHTINTNSFSLGMLIDFVPFGDA